MTPMPITDDPSDRVRTCIVIEVEGEPTRTLVTVIRSLEARVEALEAAERARSGGAS